MLKPLFKALKKRGDKLPHVIGGRSIAVGLRLLVKSMDVRIAYYDIVSDPSRPEYNEHCIFVFWHENVAMLVPHWHHCPVTLLLSQHRDAEWLCETASVLGFNIVRGSSTRGGSSAIRQLKKEGKRSSFVVTPDGPTGPRHKMALGPLFMASRLGMPIVPVGVGYANAWRMNTWDRFAVPKPGSRGRVVFGPKIRIPPGLKKPELEHRGRKLEALLNSLSRFAKFWAMSGGSISHAKRPHKSRWCQSLVFPPRESENTHLRVKTVKRPYDQLRRAS